jgi:hypothetical protein
MFLESGVSHFDYGPVGARIQGRIYDADCPPYSSTYTFAKGDLWTYNSTAWYFLGDGWSEYNPNVAKPAQMQRHPEHKGLKLGRNTGGFLTWMTSATARSVNLRKRKRALSDDDEVSSLHLRETTSVILYL